MKSVLISIRPKLCEKITSGEKTIEVRKTRPKIKTPFKCYIYCTIGNGTKGDYLIPSNLQCGKVIGEFICNRIDVFTPSEHGIIFRRFRALYETRLTVDEMRKYAKGKTLYGWNISDLKIYDKPKELSEFRKLCKINLPMCDRCEYYSTWNGRCENITRAPQSWCYVEELEK